MLRDRRWWLGGAAVLVGGLAVWLLTPASAPDAGSGQPAARTRAARPSADSEAGLDPLKPVKLDALLASREQPKDTTRNPFRFQPRAAPPPPPRPADSAPKPEAQMPAAPPAPTGPPPPPPIPLKFIGVVVRENGVRWAVLSDGKSAPQFGKEGDVIDGRYRIVKIGAESIELTYVDGRGRQTVRLTG